MTWTRLAFVYVRERWGYAVLPATPATRLLLLRAALREARLVLWLDADVRPPRQDEDLARLLRPSAFQALARTVDGRPDPGVWLLRSCPAAVALLQVAHARGSLEAALGPALRGTTWLPDRWGARTSGVLTSVGSSSCTAQARWSGACDDTL